jgi:hypothetical protein
MTASSHRSELLAAERIAILHARMNQDARARQREEMARRVTRLGSVLGTVAAILATYDLWLLVHAAGR